MGNERLVLENERLLLGIIRVFGSGFLEFLFLLLGGFGTPWVGGPRRGFQKYLIYLALKWETDFTPPALGGATLSDNSAPAVYKIQGSQGTGFLYTAGAELSKRAAPPS